MPQSHMSFDEAIDLALRVQAKKTYLTHLTMHYNTPVTLAELEVYLAPYQGAIEVAHDGLTIEI
jgi:ribonuclease BN (tRNA processing enzyme)